MVCPTVPAARANQKIASYKLCKRVDQDISAVCAAFAIILDGSHVSSACVAYGGMAAIPARAKRTEAALQGRLWNAQSIEHACAALAEDFKPLTDMRASADYRLRGAQNLLRRFFLEYGAKLATARTHTAEVSA